LLTLCTNPNLLLLDEPTNDFDIQTMNLLEELLINFDGCVLIVSHDRYLLDKVTDHIFCFEQNGVVRDFYGSYTDYRFQLSEKQKSEKKNSEKPIKEEPKQASNRKQKRSYAEQKEYEQLEKDIVLLEAEHQEIISLLNGGKGDVTQFNNWSIRYKEIEVLIEDKTLRWMDLDEICN